MPEVEAVGSQAREERTMQRSRRGGYKVDMGTETKQRKGEGQVRGWGMTQW